ncbi:MAG TPA: Tudor-knot domain-containing protein [Planctomycetaceae bacterium]|jgi:hypothetical protein
MNCQRQLVIASIRAIALLLIGCSTVAVAADPILDWRPEKTWLFAVGVLEYEHPQVWRNQPAAKTDRRDDHLVQHFRERGIPEKQIVYLRDREATQQHIGRALTGLLERTRPGDLLILYYTGHGFRDHKSRDVHFANYDAKDGPTAWPVRGIVDTVERHFQGDKALLMADCCYSGGLADEVQKRKGRIGFACLCSSFSHNSSTGNWTFTDALLKGFHGHPAVDRNGDGHIELSELADYSELDMGFIERQKAVSAKTSSFPEHWKAATTVGKSPARQGERVEVLWNDKWYRAQIITTKDGEFHIHYVNYPASWDEWVGKDRLRPYRPHEYPAGAEVNVHWSQDQNWYPARVRRSWYGLHFVHYDGYSEEYDDWVSPDSIRPRK